MNTFNKARNVKKKKKVRLSFSSETFKDINVTIIFEHNPISNNCCKISIFFINSFILFYFDLTPEWARKYVIGNVHDVYIPRAIKTNTLIAVLIDLP